MSWMKNSLCVCLCVEEMYVNIRLDIIGYNDYILDNSLIMSVSIKCSNIINHVFLDWIWFLKPISKTL